MTVPEPTPVPPAAPVAPPAMPPAARTNPLAVVSMVLGILGFNIVAVVLGHIALSQIKKTGEDGRTMAIVGLVLGYIGVVILAIFVIIVIIGVAAGIAHAGVTTVTTGS